MEGGFLVTSKDKLNLIHIRARRRFKAIVRLVIANRYWLIEEDAIIIRNLKKNMKVKKKKGKLLSLEHKILLCQPPQERSEQDKDTLYNIIGFLKCFRKYSEGIKRELAAHTYFQYFGPGRTIVRQHHEAHAMYFIVSGEVEAVVSKHDDVFGEIKLSHMVLRANDFFGDVSLLHGIPRSATITTVTHCEFIVLYKKDFDTILKEEALQEWVKILNALAQFNYFEEFSEIDKREACILAKLKSFEKDQTVLGDGEGIRGCTYFILSGTCALIENLKVRETVKNNKKRRQFFSVKEEMSLLNLNSVVPKSTPKYSDIHSASSKTTNQSEVSVVTTKTIKSLVSKIVSKDKTYETQVASEILGVQEKQLEEEDGDAYFIPGVENYFMQVCLFKEKSCFGIGEYFQRRRVIALTPVSCLLIPRFWLLKGSNIWTRIKEYLDSALPSSEEVYKEFIRGRKFRGYKKKLMESYYRRPAWNYVENIPLSIRCAQFPHDY